MPERFALPCPLAADWRDGRPRDFSARFRRDARGAGQRRGESQRRGAMLATALAAVTLPAFATPDQWDRFAIADATAAANSVEPMPFEQAGASFPGSAFYYLAPDEALPAVGEGIQSDAHTALPAATARPLRVDDSPLDRGRALKCLTAAIYYEAASEPDAGQRAVAQVVLNRVAHPAYPGTVCGVVYQGSERPTGCQFSFTCDGSLARRPLPLFWNRAEIVARQALAGQVYAPVGLATHYHTVQVNPYWAASLQPMGTIGAHRFYSFVGAAGRLAAFRFAYRGGEPIAAPHPRDDSAAALATAQALDPLALQQAFAAGPLANAASPVPAAVATTAPSYTSELRERGGDALYRARNLPESQGVRPEYANSGRWISQPGT